MLVIGIRLTVYSPNTYLANGKATLPATKFKWSSICFTYLASRAVF